MKAKLITSAYPRSGSTYLNQALNLFYYPEDLPNINRHEVIAIEKVELILVPFRSPLDSIASWHKYPSTGILGADIKYYIRFHTAVLNNLSKVVLMDFDLFTKDINYIKNRVFKNFDLTTDQNVTDEDVKKAMLANGKEINLPRNNEEELAQVKKELPYIEGFDKCLELYAQLIDAHEKQMRK